MPFVYHIVPKRMKGNRLYPLNILKKKFPSIYKEEIKKYVGREDILHRKIPPLKCLWNDVLHFSPIHPSKIKKALESTGFSKKIGNGIKLI